MDTCYMCDQPKVSYEHVPPLCLFPELKDLPSGLDLRKNLITVPSCKEHNLQKSGDDEYLLFVLVANFKVNSSGLHQWHTKIKRALLKTSSKRRIFGNIRTVIHRGVITGAYLIDFDRLSLEFDRICRALYFHHFHQVWLHEIQLAIPFALSTESTEAKIFSNTMAEVTQMVAEFLKNEPRLGQNQEVFFYQYKQMHERAGFVMRMVFYGGVEVSAISANDKNLQVVRPDNVDPLPY